MIKFTLKFCRSYLAENAIQDLFKSDKYLIVIEENCLKIRKFDNLFKLDSQEKFLKLTIWSSNCKNFHQIMLAFGMENRADMKNYPKAIG